MRYGAGDEKRGQGLGTQMRLEPLVTFFFKNSFFMYINNVIYLFIKLNMGSLRCYRRGSVQVRSTHQLDLDLRLGSRSACVWTWTRTLWVRSGPDPGPQGPGPDFGQSRQICWLVTYNYNRIDC
jgi:hypothetical protein